MNNEYEKLLSEISAIDKKIADIMAPIINDIENLKNQRAEIQENFDKAVAEQAKQQLDNKPYKCGTTYIETDHHKIKTVVSKNVKWDEKELLKTEKMIVNAGKNPRDYIKYKLSVGEKEYQAFPDEIKAVFKEARTVEPSKPKISIELKG